MYSVLRPLLFLLDEEVSHDLTIAALELYGRLPGAIRPACGAGPLGEPVSLMGLRFLNRVGLAAGLDKNARAVEGLARLGFGFVEVGTVTPRPQPGNPKPRLFRLARHDAIINRMGFNNQGAERLRDRLERVRRRGHLQDTLVGVNVGKNKDTPLESAGADYVQCMERVYPLADYLTLNLSSPNTPGLRQLQSGRELTGLLEQVVGSRERLAAAHGRRVPLLVKVAPDLHPDDIPAIAAGIREFGIDGVIATNTTVTRPGLEDEPLADTTGGLSGAPLAPLARASVRAFREALGPGVPLVGVGGIFSRAAAEEMLAAGANLVQLYSGLIYCGPGLPRRIITGGDGPAG